MLQPAPVSLWEMYMRMSMSIYSKLVAMKRHKEKGGLQSLLEIQHILEKVHPIR